MTRPTLKQVAQAAGVSTATASKALNSRSDIADATRGLVLDAAARLGYLPLRKAKNERLRPVINLVTDSIDSYYGTEVLRGIVEEAGRLGVDVVPKIESRSSQGVKSALQWERCYLRPDAVGLVLLVYGADGPVFEVARRRGVPVVVIDPYRRMNDADVIISSTNWDGGKAATQHLIDLGHRRIAVIKGTSDFLPGNERLHGYRSALAEAGLDFDESLVLDGHYTFGSGFDAAERIVEMPEPPTAVFALSDRMALGAIRAFMSHGVRVPEDMSVIGYDNSPGSELTTPALTTIAQPLAEMGRLAVRSVQNLATLPETKQQRIKLNTSLVVRASTRSIE